MDTLAFGAKTHESRWGRIFIRFLYIIIWAITPKGILINALACQAALVELCRKYRPDTVVILGGFVSPDLGVANLGYEPKHLLLGGNLYEQAEYWYILGNDNQLLPLSKSTLDEARHTLDYLEEMPISPNSIGIISLEILSTRAAATFIQESINRGDETLIIPFPCLDSRREEMLPAYRHLAVLIEAWKLWRYQLKGDVATLPTILQYVRDHQTKTA